MRSAGDWSGEQAQRVSGGASIEPGHSAGSRGGSAPRQLPAGIRRPLGGSQPVDELAAAVRLDRHHLDSRADQLSGGLKQRVAIARAFEGNPELIICDEPVSSLDVSVQAVILNLLADLQAARGTSYLFISHDLAVVRYLAHTAAVIYRGHIVEYGGVEDIFSGPHHPYTAALLSAALLATDRGPGTRPKARAWAGRQGMTDRPAAAGSCPFQASCPVKIGTACEEEAPPWQVLDRGHKIRCYHPAATLTELQALRHGP